MPSMPQPPALPAADDDHDIAALGRWLDPRDSDSVLRFGADAQAGIAALADGVLRSLSGDDAGQVTQVLDDLLARLRGLDVADALRLPGFFARLVGQGGRRLERLRARSVELSGQIDRIVLRLEEAKDQLLRDSVILDMLYERNVEALRRLEAHVAAGERVLAAFRAGQLPALEAAAQSGDALARQTAADARQGAERLERRLHDLRLSRTIAEQALPQIRLVQGGNKLLVDRIQSSILSTIPVWKHQMVVALAMGRARDALALQQGVDAAAAEQIRRNARDLKQGVGEIASTNAEAGASLAALEAANRALIDTVTEVLSLQAEGRERRRAAEGELARLDGALKAKLGP
ncbi:toxic anion resistance protein [Zavarzinia sp.]|uniref:toxic anion resistance protein n=1 Tax=Zavarzinia sp. TaxID=2027920 RepID=UPI003564AEEE